MKLRHLVSHGNHQLRSPNHHRDRELQLILVFSGGTLSLACARDCHEARGVHTISVGRTATAAAASTTVPVKELVSPMGAITSARMPACRRAFLAAMPQTRYPVSGA